MDDGRRSSGRLEAASPFRPLGLLSLEELRGLVGELWMLLNRFAHGDARIERHSRGWLGPLGRHKTSGTRPPASTRRSRSARPPRASRSARPSSSTNRAWNSWSCRCRRSTRPSVEPSTWSRSSSSRERSQDGQGDSASNLSFRLKTPRRRPEQPFYADTWFRLQAVETFDRRAEFPAIDEPAYAAGVERVRYSLDRRGDRAVPRSRPSSLRGGD